MGNEFYEGIMQGLTEALEIAQGKREAARVHRMSIQSVKEFSPGEIKQIRLASDMTQSAFAACIGVSTKSVEAWEGGRSRPDGAARRTLGLMQANPRFADEMGIITR